MSYSEIDVQEVLEGFPPPPGMTPGSKREVVRRLDEQAVRHGQPLLTATVMGKLLYVDKRTVTRYRTRNRQEAAAEGVSA